MTIEELRNNGWIVYEYIRGSHAYGTNVEGSDEDRGGVFICPPEYIYGLRSQYVEQVMDSHGDTVFYEIGRWFELLLKSNPTVLESLFVPEDCIIGEVHPIIQEVIKNRDMFLSKECFKTLTGYAVSQIHKARGLNKKIVNPVTERKSVLDFCYVPEAQGAKHIEKWLADRGLKQKYVGLVALPNMHDMYGLYYDWGTHLICEYGADLKNKSNLDEVWDRLCEEMDNNDSDTISTFADSLTDYCLTSGYATYRNQLEYVQPYGFTGIAKEGADSNEIRVCTVPRGIKPLTYMSYNATGYMSHCKDYKEYTDWEKNRNPVRYENNLGHNYDAKNLMHCMRLTRMGKELALGEGLNIRRKDKDFLLSIRNHELDYDEIMILAEKEKEEMEKAIPNCTLPDKLDVKMINDLLINIRRKFYEEKYTTI